MRTLKAQKHTDPTDPDPEHWFQHVALFCYRYTLHRVFFTLQKPFWFNLTVSSKLLSSCTLHVHGTGYCSLCTVNARFWIFHPGSGSATLNFCIFIPKKLLVSFRKCDRDVHPGSGLFFIPDLDPWSSGPKSTHPESAAFWFCIPVSPFTHLYVRTAGPY